MLETAFRIGDRLSGRFVVRSFDGQGPLGERYLALDEEVEVEVELRVVHATLLPEAELRSAFVEKMKRVRTLAHPSFLRVHDVFEDNQHAVLAVQHATGQLLSSWMEGGRVTPFAEARPVLGKVASALAHAHQLGVVLGDLRPATVMILGGAGTLTAAAVKVSSFGVALALPRDRYLSVASSQADFDYLSPELRTGSPCDARSDVYSLAALTTALLVGGQPVSADAFARSGVASAADLSSVISRGLESDPARRFPTVEAFLTALDRAGERARRREGPAIVPVPGSLPHSSDAAARGGRRSTDLPGQSGSDSPSGEGPDFDRTVTRPIAAQPVVAAPAQTHIHGPAPGDITRMVDEDELRRLAGEINDLLDTTRQVSLDEIEVLRARSSSTANEPYDSAPESGRLVLAPRRQTGAVPIVRPEEEDLSFDFDTRPAQPSGTETTRVESPRRRESSVAERMPREPASGESSGRITLSRNDAASAAATIAAANDRATEVTVLAALGEPPPLLDPADHEDAFAGLNGDPHEPPQPELFTPEQDPFAAAIEAHASQKKRPPPPEPSLEEFEDEADTRALRVMAPVPPVAPAPASSSAPSSSSPPPLSDEEPQLLEHPVSASSDATHSVHASLSTLGDHSEETNSLRAPKPREREPAAPVAVAPPPPFFIAPPPLPVQPVPLTERSRSAASSRPSAPHPSSPPSSMGRVTILVVVGIVFFALALGVLAMVSRSNANSAPPEPSPVAAAAPVPPPVAPPVAVAPVPSAVAAAPVAAPVAPAAVAPPAPVAPAAVAPPAPVAPAAPPAPDKPASELVVTPILPTAADGAADEPAAGGTVPSADAAGCSPGMVRVRTLRPFCVDSFEYPGRGQLPRTAITHAQAVALCAARGARLCGDKEWELACRGSGGASYPYGASYQAEVCNTVEGVVKPSGSLPSCRSRVGAFDMSGNVAEWTAEGTVHGGAAGEGNPAARCSHDVRGAQPSTKIGFRCCADIQ